ncbi:meiotic recombination protein REC8 homolog [Pogoniulus pusillus]|uniref:meiotic recombination protein REC8 homolog n=1 Tax=Pogoniulus pusillus TaxID=488313 RepID=UPI0030B9A5BE
MFYYPEVLQRHRGCLGTVWLAATCSSRLLRREYLGVDVPRACAAVSSFLIGRGGWEVPPPPPGAPPPRCSLRLAAQLGLGLARVYWDQCRCLLEEVRQVLERLHRARPPPRIDLSPPRRPQLLPDAQAQQEMLEQAPDPFFGLMGLELPSPTVLLAQIPSPPRRRRPAPQLPHIDLQTQIPQETFRAQLELPHIGCGELLLLPPPSKRRRTPAELFRTPTCGWLPPELLALWLRCTRPGPPRPTAPPPELPSEVELFPSAPHISLSAS